LTLANRSITKWSILDDDHTTGSEYEVIQWEVEAARQEEAGHERVVVLNLAAMKQKNMKAAEKLWTELEKERAHLVAICTEEKVQQEAAWCLEAMSIVPNATGKNIRNCTK